MGIQGLLKNLDPFAEVCHVDQFPNKRAGIDASSWLHKGAFSCARELALKQDTRNRLGQQRYVEYCLHRARMLKFNKVSPVLVFDGTAMPMKRDENIKRNGTRKENLEKGLRLNNLNIHAKIEEANKHFQGAVNVTFEMSHELLKAARAEGFEVVVAPYEADAQLAYMAREGSIDIVITEDSDLLAFGAPLVIYKMGEFGDGKMIRLENVVGKRTDGVDLRQFDELKFTQLCIMCGCDYLDNIPGLGFKKILSLFQKHKNFDRIMRILKNNSSVRKQIKLPTDYESNFQKTLTAFRHQTIFCHQEMCTKPLRPIPSDHPVTQEELGQCTGPQMTPDEARKICKLGQINPKTRLPFSPAPPSLFTRTSGSQTQGSKGSNRSKGEQKIDTNQTRLRFDVGTSLPKGIAPTSSVSMNTKRGFIPPRPTQAQSKMVSEAHAKAQMHKAELLKASDNAVLEMYSGKPVDDQPTLDAKQGTPVLGAFPTAFGSQETPVCSQKINPFKAPSQTASLLPSSSLFERAAVLDPTTAPREKKRRVADKGTPTRCSPAKAECRRSPRLQHKDAHVQIVDVDATERSQDMQWSCSKCTCLNHADIASCEACDTPREVTSKLDDAPIATLTQPKRKIGLSKPKSNKRKVYSKDSKAKGTQMTLLSFINKG